MPRQKFPHSLTLQFQKWKKKRPPSILKTTYLAQPSAQSKKNSTLKDSTDALRAVNAEARGSAAATTGAWANLSARRFTLATLPNLSHLDA